MAVPIAASSSTASPVASMSTGAPTANSFTSPTSIVTSRVVLEPSVERASIVIA